MKYRVSINWAVGTDTRKRQLRSIMHQAEVEAGLGQECSEFGYPTSFRGRLLNVSQEQLNNFKNRPDVEVSLHTGSGYIGGEYIFDWIEGDGEFQLQRA
jgi:hypothetical protein